ncbi:beta-N-acetylhexosaminidase [Lacrimispora celerecrescens]|uniref:beta-N-acetylhexosaminidase n=1 Tax=Lacrimispora celerecrescens TaxID=29354 RepID=UPI001649ED58|nr:beta-N-acetylhexosaminidase [Lacrimispora celerecrescens]
MTLKQKIGQMIVAGFPAGELREDMIRLIREYKVGNVILFSHNIESRNQLKELCESIQRLVKEETGEFAFITIDQEGGVVRRLPEGSVSIPGAMALTQTGDKENAYEAALLTGQELRELGINFNLAPVLDINNNPDNPVIGVRSFGPDKTMVSKFGCAMVKGYLDAGIMCSVKHFPGHGDTAVDSHLSLPCIRKSYEELEQEELIPFIEAFQRGATAVTLAHILFPRIEKEHLPVTMSETIIQGILRNRLGFEGLVISDCLEMNAIKEYFGTATGAKKAIMAGVDLVFISHTASLAAEAAREIERAVESGEIPISRIDDAVERILAYKKRYAAPNANEGKKSLKEAGEFVKSLYRGSIRFTNRERGYGHPLGKKPVFLSCFTYRSTLASSRVMEDLLFAAYMQERFGGDAYSFSIDPDSREINEVLEKVKDKGYTNLVLGTYNGHLNRGQSSLAKELEKLRIPMVMAAFRNPYDLDEVGNGVDKIAAYEYSRQSFEAVVPLFKQ